MKNFRRVLRMASVRENRPGWQGFVEWSRDGHTAQRSRTMVEQAYPATKIVPAVAKRCPLFPWIVSINGWAKFDEKQAVAI